MFDSSGSTYVVLQHAGVSGKPEEESQERTNRREHRLPAALSVDWHAPLQGTDVDVVFVKTFNPQSQKLHLLTQKQSTGIEMS